MPIENGIRQFRLLIILILLFYCTENIRADAEEPLKVEEELLPAIPKAKRVFPSPALYWISEPVSVRVLIGRPLLVNCQAGVGGSGVGQKAVHLRTNWYRINNASGSSASMTPIDTPSDSSSNQGPSTQKAELKMFGNGTLFSRSAHKGLQGRYACVIRSQFQALTAKISITVTGSRPGFQKSDSNQKSDAPLIKEDSPRLIPAPSARKRKSSEKIASSEENVENPTDPSGSCNAEKEEVGRILRTTLELKLTKRIREAIQRSRSELLDAGSCESAEPRHYSDDDANLFQLTAEERSSLASIERKAQRGSHVQCTAALKELIRFLEDVLKKRRDKRPPHHSGTTRKPTNNKTTKRPTRTTTTTTQSPNECLDCFGILDRLEMDLMANILRKGIEEAVQSILDQWDDGDCNNPGNNSGEDGGKSKGKKKTKKPIKTGKKAPKNGGGGKKKGKN